MLVITKLKQARNPVILIGLLCFMTNCAQPVMESNVFNTSSHKIHLPDQLREISGLTFVNDSSLACINDEQGKIFFISTFSGLINSVIDFKKRGDYEGIAFVHPFFYVLRSNGNLLEVSRDGSFSEFVFKSCKSGDFEGLCYDQSSNQLLIANKKACSHKLDKYVLIYAFDLSTKKFIYNPVWQYKRKLLKGFRPSGIDIDANRNIYLLSASSQSIIMLDSNRVVMKQSNLAHQIFAQPEGICSNPSGDIFIANEGHGRAATLIKVIAQNAH